MSVFFRIPAVLASLFLALTGGTVSLDLTGAAPTVTVCSEHGTYEMPLDMGEREDEFSMLCCGHCAPVDEPADLAVLAGLRVPTAPRGLFDAPPGFASEPLRGRPGWALPPGRAPPRLV